VNGQLAAEHEGGHTPFCADIGPLLNDAGPQVIVVRAQDDPEDLQQSRGKQSWSEQPGYIWYRRTTGIWQPVWLEPVPKVAICELRWTPDVDRAGVHLVLRLSRPAPEGWRAKIRLKGDKPARTLVADECLIEGDDLRRDLQLNINMAARQRRYLLWTPEHPNLIEAELELCDESGGVVDHIESYFGLRRIEVQDGRFILNGVPTFLRLVLAQNYWRAVRKLPKRGDLSARSALTIHRGTANRSTNPRPVLVVGVDAADATNAHRHDLQVTPAYLDRLPARVRDHLTYRIADELATVVQRHAIEGSP
jgi:hypothetical protein